MFWPKRELKDLFSAGMRGPAKSKFGASAELSLMVRALIFLSSSRAIIFWQVHATSINLLRKGCLLDTAN